MITSLIQTLPLLTAFIVFSSVGSFKQELWLYENNGTEAVLTMQFDSHVSNATKYSAALKKVTRYCARGKWFVFSKTKFRRFSTSLGLAFTDELICARVDLSDAKSFRFWGSNETSIPSMSLYSGEMYDGDEIFVNGKAHAGIRWEIKSIAVTGKEHWRLFEGKFLDKRSICYKAPATEGYFFNFDRVKDLKGINFVRSVFKGCDLKQVEMYKKHHILSEQ